jgi:nucleotide-binding universal stress UspA family protein
MRVLIAYDDSDCSKAALDDLKNAGFPADTEALVLMVTENWSLIFEEAEKTLSPEDRSGYPTPIDIQNIREKAHTLFAEMEVLAGSVAQRLQAELPSWRIRGEAIPGFAHWGILDRAREWNSDLIVVGSHGRNLVGRILLGSSSLKILSEAECSVRVARRSPARTDDDESPQRVVIGIDGSPDSLAAVKAAAARSWLPGSSIRLVSAIEPILGPEPGFDSNLEIVKHAHEIAKSELEAAGLKVSKIVGFGDPKRMLIQEAEKWGADAIFVGAKGHGLVERVLLGSVSYSVAARAECSVEVVR